MTSSKMKAEGCLDAPDSRDYKASHVLGAAPIDVPDEVNLLNIPAKNQLKTMHCTSYALTHVMEILNTIEHHFQISLNPEEQWLNQLAYPSTADEKVGDYLQSAIKALLKFGLINNQVQTPDGKLKMQGYALSNKYEDEMKGWLAKGLPIYTGCNSSKWSSAKSSGILNIDGQGFGHAICIIGYDYDGFIGLNSWGEKWGKYGNGTFRIKPDQLTKLFSCYIIYDMPDTKKLFKDVTSQSWAYEAIKECVDKGIMSGYGEGPTEERLFKPDQPISRAEVAQVASNLMKLK